MEYFCFSTSNMDQRVLYMQISQHSQETKSN